MPRKIDWMQWGREAFDRARAENKLMLLDIGAAWCHWCHVMDVTTYADPEVIDIIRERFVPVKVDTDARPDINARYNRGGWPTVAFLTPEGDPIGGGTYIPPAQMKRTMLEYSRFYSENAGTILQKANESRRRVIARTAEGENLDEAGLDNRVVERTVEEMKSHADPIHGGFGRAPKFPHPETINLALLWHHVRHDDAALRLAARTLDAMAAGGIHDQLGGGFHRYAVDQYWHLPHFEKLLDVNASLLAAYVGAWRMLESPLYRETAQGIIRFLEGVLLAPEGCFFSSQDADTYEGDDGSYFTWTQVEVKDVLHEQHARAAITWFGISPEGDVESTPGRNVLRRAMSLPDLASRLKITEAEAARYVREAMAKLAEIRARREQPKVDRKILTDWNSIAASAYFDAWEAFGEARLLERALGVVDFLLGHSIGPDGGACHYLLDGRQLLHGLLVDQACLANACLDAYEATGRRTYLDRARELLAFANARLRSTTGGFSDSPRRDDDFGELTVKDGSIYENAEAARALARLYLLTGDITWQDQARITLAAQLPQLDKASYLAAGFAIAADLLLNYPVELVTVGPADSPETKALHGASLRLYEPRRMVQLLDPRTDADLIEARGYAPPNRATLFMCVNATCGPPIHTVEQLHEARERLRLESVPSA